MKKILSFLILASLVVLITGGLVYSQEQPMVKTTKWYGNNTQINNDMSDMPETRIITQQETDLMNEIQRLRKMNDKIQTNRILELNAQLEALNPQSVSKPGEYYGGTWVEATQQNPPFIPDVIGNTEIRNTGSKLISGICTATEQRGSTAGRIWVVLAFENSGGPDSLRVYRSDNDGLSWTLYANGNLGGTDRINRDQMDMEIIENTTGDKYLWIAYGYRNTGGSGRWRTGGAIIRTPTFGGVFFGLSWPGDNSTKRYYGLRITSDNAQYTSATWVYMVASFDSTVGAGHRNTQKTVRCTSPYTTTPSFSYKADKFYWYSSATDGNLRDLHSDIAYFRHSGNDSIIVSFSNVQDSTKIFFAKSNISNGPASSTGAGGPIGGNLPNNHKQYGRLASNGNDLGRIVCVFRQNSTPWTVNYFRTTNWGNFNSMTYGGPLASTSNQSYQPDIVGVRGGITSYVSFSVLSSVDSVYFVRVANGFTVRSRRMNSVTAISGVQGSKPGFRYASGDSCFAIYSPNGPYDVWSAFGCSGSIVGITNNQTPVKYSLSQNYPNPFNPSTSIRFDIPKDGLVKLVVYDVLGKEIATIINEVKTTGSYIVDFNGGELNSGIYFYKLTAGDFSEIKKMILVK